MRSVDVYDSSSFHNEPCFLVLDSSMNFEVILTSASLLID
jgi:hypothetical protein